MVAGQTSQETINDFWKSVIAAESTQSKASAVLPPSVYTKLLEKNVPRGVAISESVETSYSEAKKDCEKKVAQIVKECRMINQKYSDPYFDLSDKQFCLFPLSGKKTGDNDNSGGEDVPSPPKPEPSSVKRVADIFDKPQFFVDGANAKDIRQGCDGDCWFLSALTALCNLDPTAHLITKICVAWDQDVGVYGFVLYRDGEWTSVIVDDKLYLRTADYEDADVITRGIWEDNRIRINSQEEYRKGFQSNSRALYFAHSTDPNETWVPLIEKAFAKAHGDYGVIEAGSVGEGVEDLTGGISTAIISTDILSKDKFWNDCMLKVNEEFLFGCGTQDWGPGGRDGIYGSHAYSVLRAVNYGKERLVLMKNPWGESEWNGPWSDGSSQWNAESIKDLNHTFGDDGIFWIRYEDMLRKYVVIWKTRLFSANWRVTQQWTNLNVPWAGEYQDTKFEVVIEKAASTVFVLSQLDDRYFRGLTGLYEFQLSFRVHRAGEEDYLLRTFGEYEGQRSVNAELDLEAGTYEVRLKISAYLNDGVDKVEDVVKLNWLERRNKLLQVGMSYDLAHAKAQLDPKPKKEPNPEPKPVATTANGAFATDVSTSKAESKRDSSDASARAGPSSKTWQEISNAPVGDYINGLLFLDVEGDSHDSNAGVDPEPVKPAGPPAASEAAGDGEKETVTWGAVCVVGLRVYCRDADATIRIVRPKRKEEESKAQEQKEIKPAKLDVDDPACDAAKGAETETEKGKYGEVKAEEKAGEKGEEKAGEKGEGKVEKAEEKIEKVEKAD